MPRFCYSPTPLRLGEGLFTYANPRPSSVPCLLCLGEGMLHLGEPLCLNEALLRLDEPDFLAGFALASFLPVLLSIFIKPKQML